MKNNFCYMQIQMHSTKYRCDFENEMIDADKQVVIVYSLT